MRNRLTDALLRMNLLRVLKFLPSRETFLPFLCLRNKRLLQCRFPHAFIIEILEFRHPFSYI